MRKSIIFLLLAWVSQLEMAHSQSYNSDPLNKRSVQELGFLVGEWKGSGWVMGSDMKKLEFDQTEIIQFKLDSTLVVIEALGMVKDKVVHNALGVVSAEKEEHTFSFQSYLQNGKEGRYKSEIKGREFRWYPTHEIRYIIRIDEDGQCVELGEISKGGNWYQFLEVKMTKMD